MYFYMQNINFSEKLYNNINFGNIYFTKKTDEKMLNLFKKHVKKHLDNMDKFINFSKINLSDEELYDLICDTCKICFEEEDYLKYISKMNNKVYNRFVEVATRMTFRDMVREGHGRDFSWWDELYQVKYIVAVSEEVDIDCNYTFSKNELQKMIEDKSIVIVDDNNVVICDKPNFEREKVSRFELLDLNIEKYFDKEKLFTKDDSFFVVMSVIRENLTKEFIFEIMDCYIDDFQADIEELVTIYSSSSCAIWFKNSEEKKFYRNLRRGLKSKKREISK